MSTQPTRRAGITRGQLLARIHCLKKEAGWDDDAYRDILQAKTGQRSCAELDFAGLARAVAVIAAEVRRLPGAAPRTPSEWGFIDSALPAKRPVLRKICAICRALGAGRTYAEGVARRQHGGVDRRLEMMSYHELYRVAQALATTQRSRQAQEGTA